MLCMLQAAEEAQNTAAAAPSRAAEKRARKKAAARAAAATAPATELPEHGQTDGDGTSAVADAAAKLRRVSLAGGAAAGATLTASSISPAAALAADSGQEQQQRPPAWMLCPITKVGSAQALAVVECALLRGRWLRTVMCCDARCRQSDLLYDAGGDGAGNAVCW